MTVKIFSMNLTDISHYLNLQDKTTSDGYI